jgi:hypothetical protein
MKNEIQRNFIDQMYDAEIKLHEDAEKKNTGIFSNKLFELRFYGYKSEYKPPSKFIKILICVGFPIGVILAISAIIDLIDIITKT